MTKNQNSEKLSLFKKNFTKMITSGNWDSWNIQKELLELLDEELDVEKLWEIKQLFLLAVAEREESHREIVFAQIIREWPINPQEKILFARIDGSAQEVPCKISCKLPLDRPLSSGDWVWLEFNPKKPFFLRYYYIIYVSTDG